MISEFGLIGIDHVPDGGSDIPYLRQNSFHHGWLPSILQKGCDWSSGCEWFFNSSLERSTTPFAQHVIQVHKHFIASYYTRT